ncbi:odorant receptor 4-like [Manduca sexta]|uniref:Odorant receptor n=1 Tax=Manduca sexta TaxID=7130 RepID=B9VH09_MANSE|nr:odorant receptor 4-like [Manduca sexta]ACM18061.1 putative odorant receptor OR3 [Manduca sexta]
MTSAGSSVAPHLRCLRMVGFCRLSAGTAGATGRGRWRRRAHGAYHAFALSATSTYVLQQLIYAYQERGDMEKLSRVMFIMLCFVTCVVKQIVFHVDATRIDMLVAGLAEPLFNPAAEWARALLRETARAARRQALAYAGCAVATCVLWIVFPVLDRARGRHVHFSFWAPIDCTHTAKFLTLLLYSFYATSLVGVGNTTMDSFVATVLHQCKTQLTILRINLETLVERARAACGDARDQYDRVVYKLLVESLVHYQKITQTCALLQDIFGAALLVQFGVGGWILCMAAYQIVSLDVMSIEFASTTLFIVCILTELFLYCYYGNEVAVESDLVLQSMYALEWLAVPRRVRRALLIAMERAQRPMRPAAGAVLPLTLDTYVKILKSSYSFYAVLRQTK